MIDFLAGEQLFEQMLELIKSRHNQQLFRTKKPTFDLAVEVFPRSISIVLHTKLLSHDLNTFWCVRLPSRDGKSMLNVDTLLKTAIIQSYCIKDCYFIRSAQAIRNPTCLKPSRIPTNQFEILRTKTNFVCTNS